MHLHDAGVDYWGTDCDKMALTVRGNVCLCECVCERKG